MVAASAMVVATKVAQEYGFRMYLAAELTGLLMDGMCRGEATGYQIWLLGIVLNSGKGWGFRRGNGRF